MCVSLYDVYSRHSGTRLSDDDYESTHKQSYSQLEPCVLLAWFFTLALVDFWLLMNIYAKTVALCPKCAADSPSFYSQDDRGMWLNIQCPGHGLQVEQVEKDADFFKRGYEQDYSRQLSHLALPVTYRCNLKCRYCYTLSNSSRTIIEDRSAAELGAILAGFAGNVTLIGGEPTVREDLPQLIELAKQSNRNRVVSVGTNGQKLADRGYLETLKASGLDFVFLSLNHPDYDGPTVYRNKMRALDNCRAVRLPVWVHQTIDSLGQLELMPMILADYGKSIFSVRIRAVKPFGRVQPDSRIFISDILGSLDAHDTCTKGYNFFNRNISLSGKHINICSWVSDVKRCDPVDSSYVISSDELTTFHRGMRIDEVMLKQRLARGQEAVSG